MKRAAAIVLMVIMMASYVSAVPLLEGAGNFLIQKTAVDPTNRIDEAGMTLLALTSLLDSYPNEAGIKEAIEYHARFLVENQNPDGGWGYYPNSPSDVISTSYALIGLSALSSAIESGKIYLDAFQVKGPVYRGAGFLKSAFNGEAWGYVKDSPTEFYPTVMALWALGVAGYSKDEYPISDALSYLESLNLDSAEEIALRLIAFHSLGYESPLIEGDLELLQKAVLEGSLSTKTLAKVTYALSLYKSGSFELAKALATLESRSLFVNDTYSWSDEMMFYPDTQLTSSYAVLPFFSFRRTSNGGTYEILEGVAQEIKAAQLPSGKWTFNATLPKCCGPLEEDVKFTYYAALALMKWYGPDDDSFMRAVDWARGRLETAMGNARLKRRITVEYYYLVKLLIAADSLTQEEKERNVELIKSLQLDNGGWRGMPPGPQPLETAMAVDLLIGLGTPANDSSLVKAKDWLLTISGGGWGVYLTTPTGGYMATKDVFTTSMVIAALAPISTAEELEPHIKWLLDQRADDGGWAFIKEYVRTSDDKLIKLPSRTETTLLSTLGLEKAGIAVDGVTSWMIEKGLAGDMLYQKALALFYLSDKVSKEAPDLSGVTMLLYTGGEVELHYEPIYSNVIPIILGSLARNSNLNIIPEEGFELSGDRPAILVGTFDSLNPVEFNPSIEYSLEGNIVRINGKAYIKDSVVAVIPGSVKGKEVIMILCSKSNYRLVVALFETNLIKYLSGKYEVLTGSDFDRDGVIEISEINEAGKG